MKKGVSPLIAWILIIGLSISLAVVVGGFIRRSAEITQESLIEEIEGGAICNKLNINAEPLECVRGEKISLRLYNRGFLAINGVKVRLFYSDNTLGNEIVSFNNNLVPEDNIGIEVSLKGEFTSLIKFQIIPIRDDIGCVDKKIELSEETKWFIGGC